MNRKTWLPVSAQECAASAVIDAEPVRAAATDFAAATSAFATNAMMTVSKVEPDSVRFWDAAIGKPYPTAAGRCPGVAYFPQWRQPAPSGLRRLLSRPERDS